LPAPYGATTTGFNRPTLQEILARIESVQLSEIDPELDVSTESPLGQQNGIVAREISLVWEAIESAHNGYDPDAAEDFLLTALAKLTGTERRAASYSLVSLQCALDSGTTLQAGVHFAEVLNNPSSRWTPVEDFTAPSTGTHTVVFRAEFTGPVPATAGSITVISTAVVGWNGVGNLSAASAGRPADDDATLRERREAQLANSGSSTLRAIRAAILDIDEVDSVLPFENRTAAVDSNGLPPHSFEMVLWTGETPTEDPAEVAQAIWDNRPAGIGSYGSSYGLATDENGDAHAVAYSLATGRYIYLDFTLTTSGGFSSAAFKAAIDALASDLHGVGDDVLATRLVSFAWQQPNVLNVISVKLGFTASPVASTDLAIGEREIALFDPARIVTS
jgi:uncharacterized phage protein gp47/JayE